MNRSRIRTLRRCASTVAVAFATVLATSVAETSPAVHADGCYTWTRTLSRGMNGDDVRVLQVRVAGFPGYDSILPIDGQYSAATEAAVRRFKKSYGLRDDGIAGPAVFARLEALQDDDCTPVHFSYDDMDDGCGGSGFDGGPLSPSQTRRNALRIMWKLESLRRAIGDHPIDIVSGFRSYECNAGVGTANSRHLYGDAADLVPDGVSMCKLARAARYRGFDGLYGPGFPNHDDHVHVSGANESWSAPDCGIERQSSVNRMMFDEQ